jgi:hypothetical protein
MNEIRHDILENVRFDHVSAARDAPSRVNNDLLAAHGMLWSIAGGGALWGLIGLAAWFCFH